MATTCCLLEGRKTQLKKLLSVLWIAIALFTFALGHPAFAADSSSAAKIFSANCAACHAGGRNIVMADKTLKKEALSKYGMDSLDAIITQVTNGKNAMPAFKGRLNAQQIEDVANYVLEKAGKGWS
jgi:cytochrome c6